MAEKDYRSGSISLVSTQDLGAGRSRNVSLKLRDVVESATPDQEITVLKALDDVTGLPEFDMVENREYSIYE